MGSLGRMFRRATHNVKSAAKQVGDAVTDPNNLKTAAALFTSPLLAQDLMAGQVAGGASAQQAFNSPGQAISDPREYFNSKNINDLLKANAAMAGAATGVGVGAMGPGALAGGIMGYYGGRTAQTVANDPGAAARTYGLGSMVGGGLTGLASVGGMGTSASDELNQVSPGSGNSDYLLGGAQQNQDTKDAGQEAAAQAADEKQQQDLLDSLYAKFGVGTSNDAVANARALEGTKNNILNAYQTQQQNNADNSYLSNLTAARQSAAGAGGLGGSQDQQVRNQLYQAYAGNRASATQGRVQAGEDMNTTLQTQRQQLEDQIKGRQRTNLSNVNADISGLNSAASGAYAKAASSAIPLAANLGAGYSLANAYGNNNFSRAFSS